MVAGTTGFAVASFFVAVFIASAGLWWFSTVLSELKTRPAPLRFSIYTFIWFAYFGLVLVLIQRTSG